MTFVPVVVGKTIARSALHLQKASPEVLLVGGIVGLVGSTVLACRATLKVETVMDEAKTKLDMAKTLKHDDYSDLDRQRDISLVYFQSGMKVAKLYGPSVVLGVVSIAALTQSHRILSTRNAALTAAYTALDRGFKEYRARVVDKYGEDEDQNFRYGSEQVQIIDSETGKKKTVTRVGIDEPSIYARFFDQLCPSWQPEPEFNLFFLKCQQNYANDKLHANGHVFLNEVYDWCGIPRSKAGSVVGWILSGDGETDNFINFGIFDGREQVARDFVNGREGAILLDFNVDGIIYDKLRD